MSKLQQELSREQEELEQGQERLAAQGQVAHDKHQALVKGEQPATAPEPTVQVTLSRPGSMTIVSHYHEAIVSNDGGMQVVLLVYDESFRYGSRVFPPEDNDPTPRPCRSLTRALRSGTAASITRCTSWRRKKNRKQASSCGPD